MKGFLVKILILVVLILPQKIEGTNSFFSAEDTVMGNTISMACWVAPTVGLDAPADNTVTNVTNLTFTWHLVSDSCPTAQITYNLQIFTDSGRNHEYAYAPGQTLPEGEYWWDVQAQDQFGNSSTTALFHLTIDRTAPYTPTLSITGSWTKLVSETIVNGDFSQGLDTGWTIAGTVDRVTDDGYTTNPNGGNMARIGRPIYANDTGQMVWENRLMQTFSSGAKNLTIDYNYLSNDSGDYDNPGFFIRLNGQEVFSRSDSQANMGWQKFNYDLTTYNGSAINLTLYSGNTGDRKLQSWTYIGKVSTYYAAAPAHATYTILADDPAPGPGIDFCRYKIGDADWATGKSFHIPEAGSHVLQFYCQDKAGNVSPISQATVITDATAPSAIDSLKVVMATNSAVLTWHAPGDDGTNGRAASYDVRYSTTEITAANFAGATKVEGVPGPKDADQPEALEILGLQPATNYWFAIKSSDEAPNVSDISNVVSGRTDPGVAVNQGDIVINELMWMGTGAGPNDEYLELRNMTSQDIPLTGLQLLKADGTDMGINFGTKTIPANGYFLITNYAPGSASSHLKSSVHADLVDSSLVLANSNLEIRLVSSGTTIDQAWNATDPTEGFYDALTNRRYSMERTNVPGVGANPLSWYTCIDSNSHSDFFTGSTDDRGTPGAPNRSENEPPVTITSTIASPSANLKLSDDGKSVSFSLNHLGSYLVKNYELTYDTDSVSQGVVGQADSGEILLGTCSTGGQCVYHTGVKNIKLKVVIENADGELVIEKAL